MKVLTINRSQCNGCGACQMVCSLTKKNGLCPSESRIRVRRVGGTETQYVCVCQHCAEPVCVSACMRGIIDKDPVTGVVTRKQEDCFTCAACKVMCPHGAVTYDSTIDAFVTCDLCGGDPACIKVCPTGALRYEDLSEASSDFRNQYAQRVLHAKEVEE